MDNSTKVNVNIANRSLSINVAEQEHDSLIQAVNMLNQKINFIKEQGRIIDNDLIIIMASLNLIHDFLKLKGVNGLDFSQFSDRIKDMLDICNQALRD